jgi:hypothetical protein
MLSTPPAIPPSAKKKRKDSKGSGSAQLSTPNKRIKINTKRSSKKRPQVPQWVELKVSKCKHKANVPIAKKLKQLAKSLNTGDARFAVYCIALGSVINCKEMIRDGSHARELKLTCTQARMLVLFLFAAVVVQMWVNKSRASLTKSGRNR